MDRDLAAAEEVATRLGGQASAWRCDVADPDEVDRVIRGIAAEHGRLNVAVNNAGIGLPPRPTVDITPQDWRRVMAVNLDGTFYCLGSEIRAMTGGSIVNMASVLGQVASQRGSAAYTASKHGVIGLTRAAAVENAQRGLRVNAVCPGYVATPLLAEMDEGVTAERKRLTPMGRLGTPEEVAELVVWLASPASSFVTGACYTVDGGYLAV
ncbi:short-chain dehydrogenase [Phycicoccus sp. DTK01]|nr:short-chain dehydrogenase [Phycicoccus sp. DTK01]